MSCRENMNTKSQYEPTAKAAVRGFYLDWSLDVGLFDAQHNLPGDGDSVEEVVDEAHVVDECVDVTGAHHQ